MESNLKEHENLRKKDLVSSNYSWYEHKFTWLLPLRMEYSQLLQDKQK